MNERRSRRDFLKITGATTLGALVAQPGPTPPVSTDAAVPTPVPSGDIDQAVAIAKADALLLETIATLNDSFDLEFILDKEAVRLSSAEGKLVGLVFKHQKSPNPRYGGDLLVSTDLDAKKVFTIQTVTGVCLYNSFEITSTIVDERAPLYEEWRSPRVPYDYPPVLLRPRDEHQWSFHRPNSPPPKDEDLINPGWLTHSEAWLYLGCNAIEWVQGDYGKVFRCAEEAEAFKGDPAQSRVVKLDYYADLNPQVDVAGNVIKP